MKQRMYAAVLGLVVSTSAHGVAQTAATANAADPRLSPDQTAEVHADICPSPKSYEAAQAFMTNMLLKPGGHFSVKDFPPGVVENAKKAEVARQAKDYPNLCRYGATDAQARAGGIAPQVVFMGDSITELWQLADPGFFDTKTIDRGISGQTSPQILLRFYQDVVDLHPRVVHIIAGTNDVAEQTGPESDETIVNNVRAMIDIAQANRIAVVVGSIPPAKDLGVPNQTPAKRIVELNRQIHDLAIQKKVIYVDYYSQLVDSDGGFKAALSNDGTHPNRDGYKAMKPLAEQAIATAQRNHK